jgi:hypothetical protein
MQIQQTHEVEWNHDSVHQTTDIDTEQQKWT